MNLKRYLSNKRGFTMIEMMVVLIIIAVLIAGGIAMYMSYIDKARVTKAKGELTTMGASLDSYYTENEKYPAGSNTATMISDEMRNAGLPYQDSNNKGILAKDPWGINYEYKLIDNGTYTLTAKDKDSKDRVMAEGKNGESTIKVTTQ